MAEGRETKSGQLSVTNYLPLLVEYFGPIRMGRLLAFLFAWGISGQPAPKEWPRRRVVGFNRASCYRWFDEVQGFREWLATEKKIRWTDDDELMRDMVAQLPSDPKRVGVGLQSS